MSAAPSDTLHVSTRKGLFELRRAGRSWSIARVSFLGDAVSLALFDRRDDTLYAALGLGHFGVKLRRSCDHGETWDELTAPAFPKHPDGTQDELPDGKPWPWRVEQIWALEAGAESQPGVLHAGTIGGGLFRSSDSGQSWTLVRGLWDHPKRKEWFGGGADLPGIHSICTDPRDAERLLVGVSCGGAWETRDGGANWAVRAQGMFAEYMPPTRRDDPYIQDPHRIVRSPTRPDRLYAQHHNGVFVTDDGGGSWRSLANVPPSVFGFAVAVHPHDADVAWLIPATKDDQRVPLGARVTVARTRDGGGSWQSLTKGLPQEHAYDLVFRHALDVDPTGERLAFGSTTGSLWVTDDGGDGWSCVSSHLPPIYAVRFA
ncbi:MAG: exo-alpha-sialidase [Polyangiales bacterium]